MFYIPIVYFDITPPHPLPHYPPQGEDNNSLGALQMRWVRVKGGPNWAQDSGLKCSALVSLSPNHFVKFLLFGLILWVIRYHKDVFGWASHSQGLAKGVCPFWAWVILTVLSEFRCFWSKFGSVKDFDAVSCNCFLKANFLFSGFNYFLLPSFTYHFC